MHKYSSHRSNYEHDSENYTNITIYSNYMFLRYNIVGKSIVNHYDSRDTNCFN